MPSNVEIKARVDDVGKLLDNVKRYTDTPDGTELLQEDTFFHVSSGRLKLRQFTSGTEAAMLVYYNRPDTPSVKLSNYYHVSVANPDELKAVLGLALGVKGVVRKRRMLYMVGQTRVHVDHVEGLGDFMELEVVLDERQTAEDGKLIADDLMSKLEIDRSNLLSGAYMDMLIASDTSNSNSR